MSSASLSTVARESVSNSSLCACAILTIHCKKPRLLFSNYNFSPGLYWRPVRYFYMGFSPGLYWRPVDTFTWVSLETNEIVLYGY